MKKFNHTEIILSAITFSLTAFAIIGIIGLIYHLFTGGLSDADYGIYR